MYLDMVMIYMDVDIFFVYLEVMCKDLLIWWFIFKGNNGDMCVE